MKKTTIALLLSAPLLFSACSSVPADEFHAVSAERDYYKIKYEQALRDLEAEKQGGSREEFDSPVPDELPAAAAEPAVEEDLTIEDSEEAAAEEESTESGAGDEAPQEPSPDGGEEDAPGGATLPRDQSTLDGTIVASDYVIVITDYRVIPPGEPGNTQGDGSVIAFWYDTTSTSDNEISPTSAWASAVELTQAPEPDSTYTLDMTALPDEKYLDTQMQVIPKGDTLSGATAYRLEDEDAPVVLTATDSLTGKEIGRQVFPLKEPVEKDFVEGAG